MNCKILLISMLLASVSCAKREIPEPVPKDGSRVTLSFISRTNGTKTFFDDKATTELWEQNIQTLEAMVFDGMGNLVVRHDFSIEEITARKATFELPASIAQTACSFYAIANRSLGKIDSKAELLAEVEESCDEYNAPFEVVTSMAARKNGFVMSGFCSQTIVAGRTTEAFIVLERTVAKVAIRTSLSSEFSEKFPGSMRIQSARIEGTASRTPLIRSTEVPAENAEFSFEQGSFSENETFDNLFYLFETSPSASGTTAYVVLKGIYDHDGDAETTADRYPVHYRIPLSGIVENKSIVRNGYYRIAVTLSDLSGEPADVVVSVCPWLTPGVQNYGLGQEETYEGRMRQIGHFSRSIPELEIE